MWAVARNDLRQLGHSPDFWAPMLVLAALFFVIIPTILLLTITNIGSVGTVKNVSAALDVLPQAAQQAIRGTTPSDRTGYALAVYLFAPMAVIVPMTISTAVGANALVGEKEKGTGEFLANSPASEREIYLGKLIASLLPGYMTTLIGFGCYSLAVNLIVGPHVGGWFFPTAAWWTLMLWVVPPFLAITLSVVLRLSARVKSAAAAQQASGLPVGGPAPVGAGQERGRGPAGVRPRHPPADHAVLRPVDRRPPGPRLRRPLGRAVRLGGGHPRPQAGRARRHPPPPARRRRLSYCRRAEATPCSPGRRRGSGPPSR
jgi:hypothetical protein